MSITLFSSKFINSFLLLYVLLNPFLMSVYLMDLIRGLHVKIFYRVLTRGSLISVVIFILCAWGGDAIFEDVFQVRFASFLIFGGVVFIIISTRYVFQGSDAIAQIRGKPEHIAGSIAMPFMIGPGTVSASMIIGSRLNFLQSTLIILAVMISVIVSLLILKFIHDYVQKKKEELVERYIDIVGRLSALLAGTIAVDMILNGISLWLEKLGVSALR